MNRSIARVVGAALVGATVGTASLQAQAPATPDLLQTARAAGSFTTLLAAIDAAGLTQTLQGAGPFTVFAPTDAAFAALPAGTVQALLADPARLRGILTYHVVAGSVPASQVVGMRSAATVNGREVAITAQGGEVRLNGVKVTRTDIRTSNGIIHVIDGVLLPTN